MNSAPRSADPDLVGYSLANVSELLLACLDAVGARSVLEIGAFRGELTGVLLGWAADHEASITAVDPLPAPELLELAAAHPKLVLLRELSHQVLGSAELPDAVILDGDHNHYTLSEELRTIAERSSSSALPLLVFHDVCWPHARRDSYYAPERVPAEHRQPLVRDARLQPGNPGIAETGLPFECAAASEGGERNGVLTAIEDFIAQREGLRLAIVPAFFGFAVLWEERAPWAAALAATVAPLDRNPVLERLEQNRVAHLVAGFSRRQELDDERRHSAGLRRILASMLDSRAFTLAAALSRLRRRRDPVVSRPAIRAALQRRDG
jgi:predicted O-methyltransferase YrrM